MNLKNLFRNKDAEPTQEELLFDLLKIRKSGMFEAPKRILLGEDWMCVCVGVGNDETAELLVHKSTIKALEKIIGAKI